MLLKKHLSPEGVEDLHSVEYEFKDRTEINLKRIFKSFGYKQIATPTLEYYDLYNGIGGSTDKDKMFKLVDNNGKILVLRPDATVPVARMAALNYKKGKSYLKLSYIASIFRLNSNQQGDKREFVQGGIEYFGNDKPDCDAEVIAVGIKSLLECRLKNFHIDLGQIEFLNGLIEETKLNKEEKNKLYNLIENKNYGELKEFLESVNLPSGIRKIFNKIPKLYGRPEKVLAKAKGIVVNRKMEKALNNLEVVYNILKDYGYDEYILLDLGFTKEMNYYTGVMFKGYVSDFGEVLLSGGRYDKLTEEFGLSKPACGLGLNIDKLIEAMEKYNLNKDVECSTDYLILYREDLRETAINISQQLRNKGLFIESNLYDGDIERYLEGIELENYKKIIEVSKESIKIKGLGTNEINKYNHEDIYELIKEDINSN